MPVLACPNRESLSAYMFARLPAAEREEIDRHIEACSTCQSQLDTIAGSGTLVSALRAANDPPSDPGSDPSHVIARIEALGRDPSFAGLPNGTARSSEPLGVIRDYQLLAKLGEGGMGAVYKALHTRLDKVVALKVLPEDRLSPEAVARFQREMKAVGKLDHPHIVRAMDAGEHAGRHFLVMEHVEGVDLAKVARRRAPLAVADACEIIRQAALGLQHAHEHGLVHRDIKPSNIMLTRGGQVKILDLGLALLNGNNGGAAGREMTSTGQVMGTLDYMAPEQADDSHQVDIRADLYSLGVTLYKLLTGQVPLAATPQDSPLKRLLALASQPPVPVTRYRSDLPEMLTQVLGRLLSKDPAQRPRSPSELVASLAPLAASSDLAALAESLAREDAVPETAKPNGKTEPVRSSAMVDTDANQTAAPSATAMAASPVPAASSSPATDHRPPTTAGSGNNWNRLLIALAAGAAGIVALLGIWLVIRDRDGKEIGRIQVPDDAKIVQEKNGKETPLVPATPGEAKPKPADPMTPAPVVPSLPMQPLAAPPALPDIKGGDPLSDIALVVRPAVLPGVKSWSIETTNARGGVFAAAFSPDGKFVAAGCLDGTIRIWDVASEELVRVLVGHQAPVGGLTWSAKTGQLISASQNELIVWNPAEGRKIKTIAQRFSGGHQVGGAAALAIHPDGRMLGALDHNNGLVVIDLETGTSVRYGEIRGFSLEWSPDGTRLLAAQVDSYDGLWIWNPVTKSVEKKIEGHGPARWMPDGKGLIYVKRDRGPMLYDLEKNQELDAPSAEQSVARKVVDAGRADSAMAVHLGTNRAVVATYDGLVRLVDLKNPQDDPIPLSRGTGWQAIGNPTVAWTPNGKAIAIGFGDGGIGSSDRGIRYWPLSAREAPRNIDAGGRGCNLLTFAPDGLRLFLGTFDGGSDNVVYDVATGRCPWEKRTAHDYGARAAAWKWEGNRIAVKWADEAKIRILNAATGESFQELDLGADFKGAETLYWVPNSETLLISAAGRCLVWDMARGVTSEKPLSSAWLPMQSADGLRFAATDEMGPYLVDTRSGETIRRRTLPTKSLNWNRGTGNLMAAGFDAKTGRFVLSHLDHTKLTTLKSHPGILPGVFNADGRLIASQAGSAVFVWETDSGRPVCTFVRHKLGSDVILSPDGHHLPCAIDHELRYVALLDDGTQQTFTAAEFEKKFGWKNDPSKVTVAGLQGGK